MKIEIQKREYLLSACETCPAAELVAQQIIQAAAIDALEYLIDTGFSEEKARKMLRDLRENADLLHELAKRRGPGFVLERE